MERIDGSISCLVIIFAADEILDAMPHQHQEDGEAFQQVKMCYAFFVAIVAVFCRVSASD